MYKIFFVLVKNDGRVRHFIIRGSESSGNFSVVPKATFETVAKLVKFYQENSSPTIPKLVKPCARVCRLFLFFFTARNYNFFFTLTLRIIYLIKCAV